MRRAAPLAPNAATACPILAPNSIAVTPHNRETTNAIYYVPLTSLRLTVFTNALADEHRGDSIA